MLQLESCHSHFSAPALCGCWLHCGAKAALLCNAAVCILHLAAHSKRVKSLEDPRSRVAACVSSVSQVREEIPHLLEVPVHLFVLEPDGTSFAEAAAKSLGPDEPLVVRVRWRRVQQTRSLMNVHIHVPPQPGKRPLDVQLLSFGSQLSIGT